MKRIVILDQTGVANREERRLIQVSKPRLTLIVAVAVMVGVIVGALASPSPATATGKAVSGVIRATVRRPHYLWGNGLGLLLLQGSRNTSRCSGSRRCQKAGLLSILPRRRWIAIRQYDGGVFLGWRSDTTEAYGYGRLLHEDLSWVRLLVNGCTPPTLSFTTRARMSPFSSEPTFYSPLIGNSPRAHARGGLLFEAETQMGPGRCRD